MWERIKPDEIKRRLNTVYYQKSTKEPIKIIKPVENSNNKVLIEFQQYKWQTKVRYSDLLLGNVKNNYYPSVYNIGYIGDFSQSFYENGKQIKEYDTWKQMFRRCYSEEERKKWRTYENCIVCEEWHNFTNFYNWIIKQENYDKWKNIEGFALDKDILIKKNNIYSPNTCCLVPQLINNLLTKSEKIRGDCPIGVKMVKPELFVAQISIYDYKTKRKVKKSLGYYITKDEAFEKYKRIKEKYIKEIAEKEYSQGNITKECYEALNKYIVEKG